MKTLAETSGDPKSCLHNCTSWTQALSTRAGYCGPSANGAQPLSLISVGCALRWALTTRNR